jgi:hypothetical protein
VRLDPNPQLPQNADSPYSQSLYQSLTRYFQALGLKVNGIADGKASAIDNAVPSAPTTGQFNIGDFIRNSAPTELGTAGSKYTLDGWVCVLAGNPGTLLQRRSLTGN